MSKGFVFALTGLVSVVWGAVFAEKAKGQSATVDNVLVVMKSGGQMTGKVDVRSDETTLWVRLEGESTILLRPIRRTEIRRLTPLAVAVDEIGAAEHLFQQRVIHKSYAELAVEWLGLASGFLSHR